MANRITNSKDLIMLLLYAKGHTGKQCEPIVGRTRLVKMIFLFNKEIRSKFNLNKVVDETALPNFTAFDYGPFSEQVYADLEFLVDTEFVSVKRVGDNEDVPEETEEYEYWQSTSGIARENQRPEDQNEFTLTQLGNDFVEEELTDILSNEQWKVLDEFKSRCTSSSLKSILRYVYEKYPSMTHKSKIRDQVLPGSS